MESKEYGIAWWMYEKQNIVNLPKSNEDDQWYFCHHVQFVDYKPIHISVAR